ncbi:preprotein translocase subunit YajC [Corynebacterium variabile]|uniref:preprotein translocase subunit YajC n=1 Tax=Corynebacterium variabile TaxID=1727 RepID=UPI003F90BD65
MDILLLALLVVVFLGLPVLQMRKQSKQVGVIKDFQSKLAPGMVVQLTSGLHGRLTGISETTVDIEIAEDVVTTWERAAVLKLVDSVEVGSTEADHLTGRDEIPDDLSSLGDNDFDRDNNEDTDGTDGADRK